MSFLNRGQKPDHANGKVISRNDDDSVVIQVNGRTYNKPAILSPHDGPFHRHTPGESVFVGYKKPETKREPFIIGRKKHQRRNRQQRGVGQWPSSRSGGGEFSQGYRATTANINFFAEAIEFPEELPRPLLLRHDGEFLYAVFGSSLARFRNESTVPDSAILLPESSQGTQQTITDLFIDIANQRLYINASYQLTSPVCDGNLIDGLGPGPPADYDPYYLDGLYRDWLFEAEPSAERKRSLNELAQWGKSLFCIDSNTGETLWQREFVPCAEPVPIGEPFLHNGALFVFAVSQEVVLVNLALSPEEGSYSVRRLNLLRLSTEDGSELNLFPNLDTLATKAGGHMDASFRLSANTSDEVKEIISPNEGQSNPNSVGDGFWDEGRNAICYITYAEANFHGYVYNPQEELVCPILSEANQMILISLSEDQLGQKIAGRKSWDSDPQIDFTSVPDEVCAWNRKDVLTRVDTTLDIENFAEIIWKYPLYTPSEFFRQQVEPFETVLIGEVATHEVWLPLTDGLRDWKLTWPVGRDTRIDWNALNIGPFFLSASFGDDTVYGANRISSGFGVVFDSDSNYEGKFYDKWVGHFGSVNFIGPDTWPSPLPPLPTIDFGANPQGPGKVGSTVDPLIVGWLANNPGPPPGDNYPTGPTADPPLPNRITRSIRKATEADSDINRLAMEADLTEVLNEPIVSQRPSTYKAWNDVASFRIEDLTIKSDTSNDENPSIEPKPDLETLHGPGIYNTDINPGISAASLNNIPYPNQPSFVNNNDFRLPEDKDNVPGYKGGTTGIDDFQNPPEPSFPQDVICFCQVREFNLGTDLGWFFLSQDTSNRPILWGQPPSSPTAVAPIIHTQAPSVPGFAGNDPSSKQYTYYLYHKFAEDAFRLLSQRVAQPYHSAKIAVGDEYIYLISRSSPENKDAATKVVAINPLDFGDILWEREFDEPFVNPLYTSQGLVLVSFAKLFLLNLDDGTDLLEEPVEIPGISDNGGTLDVVIASGDKIFGSNSRMWSLG